MPTYCAPWPEQEDHRPARGAGRAAPRALGAARLEGPQHVGRVTPAHDREPMLERPPAHAERERHVREAGVRVLAQGP